MDSLLLFALLRPRQPCHGAQGMDFGVQIVRGPRPKSEKWAHAMQVGSGVSRCGFSEGCESSSITNSTRRDGVARKRLRLCQESKQSTAARWTRWRRICVGMAHRPVLSRGNRSGVQIDNCPEVFVDGSQDDHNIDRHAILAVNVEDDFGTGEGVVRRGG